MLKAILKKILPTLKKWQYNLYKEKQRLESSDVKDNQAIAELEGWNHIGQFLDIEELYQQTIDDSEKNSIACTASLSTLKLAFEIEHLIATDDLEQQSDTDVDKNLLADDRKKSLDKIDRSIESLDNQLKENPWLVPVVKKTNFTTTIFVDNGTDIFDEVPYTTTIENLFKNNQYLLTAKQKGKLSSIFEIRF